jgi:hypothetical protein
MMTESDFWLLTGIGLHSMGLTVSKTLQLRITTGFSHALNSSFSSINANAIQIAKMASSPTLSNRIPPILILTILAIFGLDALILQLNRNGYAAMFSSIIRDPLPRFLPDTDRLLVKQYIGFKPLDYFFVLGNVFWANVTDGSRPELSLFMFCFGGQLIAMFMVFIIEGQRTVGLAPVVLK